MYPVFSFLVYRFHFIYLRNPPLSFSPDPTLIHSSNLHIHPSVGAAPVSCSMFGPTTPSLSASGLRQLNHPNSQLVVQIAPEFQPLTSCPAWGRRRLWRRSWPKPKVPRRHVLRFFATAVTAKHQ